LRKKGVVNKFVEFLWHGIVEFERGRSRDDWEYVARIGATIGFFPGGRSDDHLLAAHWTHRRRQINWSRLLQGAGIVSLAWRAQSNFYGYPELDLGMLSRVSRGAPSAGSRDVTTRNRVPAELAKESLEP